MEISQLGQHDDFCSASYFAVADVTATDLNEATNFYSGNFLLVNNANSKYMNVKNSFF